MQGRLSVVIPVYRSEAYLERTVRELLAWAPAGQDLELMLVNDGSPDGVQRVIERLHREDPRVRYLQLGGNLGQHRALLRGLAACSGEVAVTIDDDGQNPPSVIDAVVKVLEAEDLDVVYGRVDAVEQSWGRSVASHLNRKLSRLALRNEKGLAISNVRAIRGDLARALGRMEIAYPYIEALIFKSTHRIGETPITHRRREDGRSTYSLSGLLRLWLSHLTTLTILPLKVAIACSFGASVGGFALGVIQLVRALADRRSPEGWLSLFCAVTFLFSLLFAFLGVISLYLGRMYVGLNERGLAWVRSQSLPAAIPGRTGEAPAPIRSGVA